MAATFQLLLPTSTPPLSTTSQNLRSPSAPSDLLQRATDLKSLQQLHAHLIKSQTPHPLHLQTKLTSLYSLFNRMDSAELAFQRLPTKPTFAWNSMIRGHSTHGYPSEAIHFYSQMLHCHPFPPDSFTFPFLLKACSPMSAIPVAQEAHGRILKTGLESDVYVATALAGFYLRVGELRLARKVFDGIPFKNVVSWNAFIAGLAYNELDSEAVDAFKQMVQMGIEPNTSTLVSVLPCIARLGDLEEGRFIHEWIREKGVEVNDSVMNSLIAMYGKCGELDTARGLFDGMARKTVVTWTTMISAYAQKGSLVEALNLFLSMQSSGVMPSEVTITSLLPVCADLMDLKLGMMVHGYSIKYGYDLDLMVSTALVDMHAKTGCLTEARRIFDDMPERNVVSWNAMINGFGIHGLGKDALEWFTMMQLNGIQPNGSTFVTLISACSHAGMVDEGLRCFDSMSDYRLDPDRKHCACVVDLLARAGRLKEAYEFIQKMPSEPDDAIWGSLLGGCRIHKDVKLGEMAALKAIELKPEEPGYYVSLANIYAADGRWEDAQKLRGLMKEKKIIKEAGRSSIEEGGAMHSFVVGDFKHPLWKQIHEKMEEMEERLREEGYVPDTSFVLHEAQIEKDGRLILHSERIALAFGLLKVGGGIPIRISKNLRVCGDCHSAFKLASRIYGREIVVRDLHRFHRFEGGTCSCNDYW